MSKRVLAVLIAVAVALLVLAVTIPRVFDSTDAIGKKTVGTWQEIGQTPAMTIWWQPTTSIRATASISLAMPI